MTGVEKKLREKGGGSAKRNQGLTSVIGKEEKGREEPR